MQIPVQSSKIREVYSEGYQVEHRNQDVGIVWRILRRRRESDPTQLTEMDMRNE